LLAKQARRKPEASLKTLRLCGLARGIKKGKKIMKKIIHVVGARPNFMKAAPVLDAISKNKQFKQILVHTGQHYDENMSRVFFEELGLPRPDVDLGVGSCSHAEQTAKIMMSFEDVVLKQRPDLVLVYGDVNSTVAASLVAAKLNIPIGHVEAGLRSFDRTMPEEINRLVTDQLADILFTPSKDGDENLLREGIAREKIFLVGNVMIDTLKRLLPQAEDRQRLTAIKEKLGLSLGKEKYVLVTLHRPSNVDDTKMLLEIIRTLENIAEQIKLIFPLHPRTRHRLTGLDFDFQATGITFIEPLGYLDFLALQKHATLVITDSGGIQEETTYLQVPCLTVRKNTERPITVTMGTNKLVGQDMELLKREAFNILAGNKKSGSIPPLWDGRASKRIAEIINSVLEEEK
jgi:UDP-N-acetylglucosamine 2-epimerase (non-hydrolysing)